MLPRANFLAVLSVLAVVPALAQDADPPSRVARLNYLSGAVSFRPGSVDDWAAASLNYPLTTGDHLWTDQGAQTEIHVGSAGIRMASQTALSFLNLDDHTVQLSVTEGTVNVRVRNLAEDETFEVDTPNIAVTILRPGEYRIDADGDRNTTVVTVRSGDVAVTGGGAAFPVHARESARVVGMDTVTQDLGAAPPPDEFDRWCAVREARLENVESARYVSPEMTGCEDLDQYGVWREEQQYGWIWAPRVEAGWAPYHDGHWAWVEPWGWTWVDDAPWGFAPFHYGRWAMLGGGWVWVPGARVLRPVYAPALVVFVGGPRFGLAIGMGGGGMAAWFPLGPREVYRPAYHVSEVYVRQVNIAHVTNINMVNVTNARYVNREVPRAVMAVDHETFVSARPVARGAVRVDARELAQAPVYGSTAPVAPRRESVIAGTARAGGPPARFAERTVVAKTPPPPPPVSFQTKQRALDANGGRPLDAGQLNNLRGSAPPRQPAVRTVAPARRNADFGNAPATRPNPPAPREAEQPQVRRPVPAEQPRVDRPAVVDRPNPPAAAQRPPQEDRPAGRAKPDNAAKKAEKKTDKKEERK